MSLALLVLLTLAGAALAPVVVRRAGRHAGPVLALLPLALFVLLLGRVVEAGAPGGAPPEHLAWAPALGLALAFRLDGLALLFALLVTGVGALVVLYAGRYLEGHPALGRFYVWLLLFMAAMLGVVTSDNLLLLYVFWELTSITSYLLIGFAHAQAPARRAALQGLLVTVAGGQAMLVGFLLLAHAGGTYSVSELVARGDVLRAHPAYLPALVLVLAGALTKSAQVPLHGWLPGAMAAPTPVSAYLHSATMVKAGVFLLLRLHPALGGTAAWTWSLVTAGGLTLLWAAVRALAQTDLKRLLAWATLATLGLLVGLVGLGTPTALQAALAFLVGHALYKGALFLVAGTLDHETGTREVGQLGGLARAMPWTAGAALTAAAGMAGLLPAFGFVGKELAYAAVLEGPGAAWLGTAAALAFACLVAVAFQTGVRPFLGARGAAHGHEGPASLWAPPLVLGVLGLAFGLAPGTLEPVLAPAVAATLAAGAAAPPPLALWHGVNVALGLSVLSLGGGVLLFGLRGRVRAGLLALPGARRAPGFGFDAALRGLGRVADLQTRALQTGALRQYLVRTLAASFGLVGAALLLRGGPLPALRPGDVQFHEGAVAALTVAAALVTVRARSRIAAVSAMGVVGFGVALTFLFFGAPDLALTQAIVETLTVVVFLLALLHLPRPQKLSSPPARLRDGLLAVAGGAVMTVLVLAATASGAPAHVADFHARASLPEAHGHNVVNVILTDFRALDTLGEITVLAIAAVGVHALLKLRRGPEGRTA